MIAQTERYLPSQERIERLTAEFREEKLRHKKATRGPRKKKVHNTRVYRFRLTSEGPVAEVVE